MMKKVMPSIVGMFMACMPLNPVNSSTIDPSSLSFQPFDSDEQTINIDKHVVFVLDRSSSMTSKELSILKESIITAFHDENTMDLAFSSGKKNAITIVSFASFPHTSKTYVVSDRKEALDAVNSIFLEQSKLDLGLTTQMNTAMNEVSWLFSGGEIDRGIQSSSKAVIVIGDTPPQDETLTKKSVQFLQSTYHASFFCIPIMEGENLTMSDIAFGTDFYMNNLKTPKGGLKVPNQYGGQDIVQEGMCLVAQNADTGSKVIMKAFAPIGG